MDLKKRNEMLAKMNINKNNSYTEKSEAELLEKLNQVTEEIHQSEAKIKIETHSEKILELRNNLDALYESNSLIFEVLFIKYGYNVITDEICELLDVSPNYLFLFLKHTFFNYIKVTTGATRFIKKFIFEDAEGDYAGLKKDREGNVLEEAQFFQAFHRKKLFFKLDFIAMMLLSCEVADSRIFVDIDLSDYFYRNEAEQAIREFLVREGYSKVIEKKRMNRKTKKEETIYKIESVNKPEYLSTIVPQILTGEIKLMDANHFKEQVVREHCKAAYVVHPQQCQRFLADSERTEFIKFAMPSTSESNKRPNLRYFGYRVAKDPGAFRIAVAWGTDIDVLKKQIFEHIKEFKYEKKSK